MPCFYDDEVEDNFGNRTNNIRLWKPLLFCTFFYYFLSCGIERIYQPMVCCIRFSIIIGSFLFGRIYLTNLLIFYLTTILGIHLWTLWTVETLSFRSCRDRSIIQWGIYGRKNSFYFRIKGENY